MLEFTKRIFGWGKSKTSTEEKKNAFSGQSPINFPVMGGNPNPINNFDTVLHNFRSYLVTNMWANLNWIYTTIGIVRTFIDVVVDDAFSKGWNFSSKDLSTEESDAVRKWLMKKNATNVVKTCFKWVRLYGGGGVVVDTNDGASWSKLKLGSINSSSQITLVPATMWELFQGAMQYQDLPQFDAGLNAFNNVKFKFYGITIDPSRVLVAVGRQAPPQIRAILRGWGVSELEAVLGSINSYLQATDASFEMVKNAKVDIYKMNGLNDAIVSGVSMDDIEKRMHALNYLKNYRSMIVVDKEDDFEQKIMSFAGLSDIMVEIRRQLSSELGIPENRLFGVGASGFSSGQDTSEAYQTLISGHVQEPAKRLLAEIVKIGCANTLDYVPRDISIDFEPMQALTSQEEEDKKNKTVERIIQLVKAGIMSPCEAKEEINKTGIYKVKLPENNEVFTNFPDQVEKEVVLDKDNFNKKTA